MIWRAFLFIVLSLLALSGWFQLFGSVGTLELLLVVVLTWYVVYRVLHREEHVVR